jgi:hypothetical protein
MSKRKRDYKQEYARRAALGAQHGLSRSAARGHPRAGERRQKATERSFDPSSREELALKMMRREKSSLRDAAARYGIGQERLRAYEAVRKGWWADKRRKYVEDDPLFGPMLRRGVSFYDEHRNVPRLRRELKEAKTQWVRARQILAHWDDYL